MKTTLISVCRLWLNNYCTFFCLYSVMNLEVPSYISPAFPSCISLPFRCDSYPILSFFSIVGISYVLLRSPEQDTEFNPLCLRINYISSVTVKMSSQTEYPELNTIYTSVQYLFFLLLRRLSSQETCVTYKLLPSSTSSFYSSLLNKFLFQNYHFQDPVNLSFLFSSPNTLKTGVGNLWVKVVSSGSVFPSQRTPVS